MTARARRAGGWWKGDRGQHCAASPAAEAP